MKIQIKKLNPEVTLPSYARQGDAGLDMRSLEDCTLKPGERHLFMCGFAMEFPEGYGAFVMDKGGMGMKGVKTLGGVFDAGYRGEYNVNVINLSSEIVAIKKDQKIAQLVILPIAVAELEEVSELSSSEL